MAKKTKALSEDLWLCIVSAHKEGKGCKAILKQFRVPDSTIQRIIRKNKKINSVKKKLKDAVGRQQCPLVWQEKYCEMQTTINRSKSMLS